MLLVHRPRFESTTLNHFKQSLHPQGSVRVGHPKMIKGFPDGAIINNLPASAGDTRDEGSIPALGRSPGKWQPTSVFLPEKFCGQRRPTG